MKGFPLKPTIFLSLVTFTTGLPAIIHTYDASRTFNFKMKLIGSSRNPISILVQYIKIEIEKVLSIWFKLCFFGMKPNLSRLTRSHHPIFCHKLTLTVIGYSMQFSWLIRQTPFEIELARTFSLLVFSAI